MNRPLLSAALVLCFMSSGANAQSVTAGGGSFIVEAFEGCHSDLTVLNQMFGWQVRWPSEWQTASTAGDTQLREEIARWSTVPAALAADQAALASSDRGAAPRPVVERVLEQLAALKTTLHTGPPAVSAAADPHLKQQWADLFTTRIVPAIDRYEAFLKTDYLARSADKPGLLATRDGGQCFQNLVKRFTSLDIPPAEIESTGWSILRSTESEIAKLNGIRPGQLPSFLQSLRDHKNPAFDGAALLGRSEAALKRAEAAMPRMFPSPAGQPIIVSAMPKVMEKSFPAGFYQPAEDDRPAAVVINLSRPQDRELMAEVVAFHEGLPGHHILNALGYPRGQFNSGFLEGWALYSEYVADEAGLYSGSSARTGMMAKHLWAASRLVVEPGIHLHGWSRAQAIDFMIEHTALSRAEIELEVDRYIAMPGQSLSYMLGYDRIAKARRYAEAKLGKNFDIRGFHAAVLGKGSRTLAEMDADVRAWADRASGSRPAGSP